MKALIVILSFVIGLALTSCGNTPAAEEKKVVDEAISDQASDFQQVEIIGNTVVYTHIFDGILDIKTYTYEGDECVEVERVYVFPDQMSALRHYRRAIEKAELYEDIQLFKNEIKYNLKEQQYKLETAGLTKEQLKAKFDKQIKDVKADLERVKRDCKDCK